MSLALSADQIAEAAQRLAEARRTVTVIDGLGPLAPVDAATAEAISDAHAGALDLDLIGWKVGCTSEIAMQMLGSPGPFAGRVFADTSYTTGDTAGASLISPMLECEFAFILGADLPARDEPYTDVAEVRAATESVAPAIELVASRLADSIGAGYLSLIADHGSNGGVVLGEPIAVADVPDLADIDVSCTIDGEPKGSGPGRAILGDPWNSLLWLTEHLRGRGIGLTAGQFVLSGTCTGLDPLTPGCVAVTNHGPLGSVSVTMAATPGSPAA